MNAPIYPNEHGVFTSFTEHIQYRGASGVKVDVFLVESEDGWRWGYEYMLQWGGGGAYPSHSRDPCRTRRDALEAAIECVAGRVCAHPLRTLSRLEIRQRQEVEHWCTAHRQLALL